MHRFHPTSVTALAAGLALVLAACGGGATSPTTAESQPFATAEATAEPTEATAEPTQTATAPGAEPDESEEPTAEEMRVRLESSRFEPEELSVETGTTVLFLNADSYAHTVTEGTGGQATESPIVDRDLAGNRAVRVTFDEPGTYEITCRIHPSMQMTVTVEG